jgi:hypothetical protein
MEVGDIRSPECQVVIMERRDDECNQVAATIPAVLGIHSGGSSGFDWPRRERLAEREGWNDSGFWGL